VDNKQVVNIEFIFPQSAKRAKRVSRSERSGAAARRVYVAGFFLRAQRSSFAAGHNIDNNGLMLVNSRNPDIHRDAKDYCIKDMRFAESSVRLCSLCISA
jgi:hypothetical protein